MRVNYQGSSTPLRFIGIDTPEQGEVCFDEATDAMADLVSRATVRIDVDVSDRDRFDRLLRYVFLTDGTFVNEQMVRLGWAEATDFPPDSQFASLFALAERGCCRCQAWEHGTHPTVPVVTLNPHRRLRRHHPPAAIRLIRRCASRRRHQIWTAVIFLIAGSLCYRPTRTTSTVTMMAWV